MQVILQILSSPPRGIDALSRRYMEEAGIVFSNKSVT